MTEKAAGAQGHTDSAAAGGTGTTGTTGDAGKQTPAADAAKAASDAAAATAAAAKAAADGKTGDAAGKEPGGKDGAGDPQPKAPAKYELKVPEAALKMVDAGTLADVEARARELDLPNDEAQIMLEDAIAFADRRAAAMLERTRADKEYGGDKLGQTQQLANRVIDRVYPTGHARREAFLGFMEKTGAGNAIEVVAFLADLGKRLGEDSPAHTRASGTETAAVVDKMYDHPTSKALNAQTT